MDDDDALRQRPKHKKHKYEREHKRDKSNKRRHHDSDSEDEEQEKEPWHGMHFELVDNVNGYGSNAPDSRTLSGVAKAKGRRSRINAAAQSVDMSDFARLVSYLHETFPIDSELVIVLHVQVRASS